MSSSLELYQRAKQCDADSRAFIEPKTRRLLAALGNGLVAAGNRIRCAAKTNRSCRALKR